MDYAVGIDFESFGGNSTKHGFTQLGASIISMKDQKEIASFNEYANQKGYEKEERCMKEFWEKHPERLEETERLCGKSKLSPCDVVDAFYEWLSENLPSEKANIVTDNAGYDAGVLRTFSNKDPLYAIGGQYREILDVSMFYYGMGLDKFDQDKSSKKTALAALGIPKLPTWPVEHDHNAVNDARTIAYTWAYIQSKLPVKRNKCRAEKELAVACIGVAVMFFVCLVALTNNKN